MTLPVPYEIDGYSRGDKEGDVVKKYGVEGAKGAMKATMYVQSAHPLTSARPKAACRRSIESPFAAWRIPTMTRTAKKTAAAPIWESIILRIAIEPGEDIEHCRRSVSLEEDALEPNAL